MTLNFSLSCLTTPILVFGLFVSSIPAQSQQLDSVSYSLGLLVGSNLANQGFDQLDPGSLAQGLTDVMKDGKARWNEEMATVMVQAYLESREKERHAETIALAKAFFAENGRRPGIRTRPSGLQYEILQSGEGPSPRLTDQVTTHYHGTLLNGEVFDSSVDRGEPVSFPVDGVISGWTEALQLMKVGDKWRLFLPSDLAYGSRGIGGVIGPFEPLVFEVELIEITPMSSESR
jgi:FKBP-type peptidyl-prolyl cis-trans isomerase FklB